MAKSALREQYRKELAPKLQKELNIKNVFAVPQLQKIVLNVGLGSYLKNSKDFDPIVESLKAISGQKPLINRARKSVSNFKLREGTPNGASVTLRGGRMYDFLQKLISVVFPRVRDFRGFPLKIFDGRGNCTIGLREHIVFPEINPDDIAKIHGLEVTIVTTAKDDTEGKALLKIFGFPFKKETAAKPAK